MGKFQDKKRITYIGIGIGTIIVGGIVVYLLSKKIKVEEKPEEPTPIPIPVSFAIYVIGVIDEKKYALANAIVELKQKGIVKARCKSIKGGICNIYNLLTGVYDVIVSASGHEIKTQRMTITGDNFRFYLRRSI